MRFKYINEYIDSSVAVSRKMAGKKRLAGKGIGGQSFIR